MSMANSPVNLSLLWVLAAVSDAAASSLWRTKSFRRFFSSGALLRTHTRITVTDAKATQSRAARDTFADSDMSLRDQRNSLMPCTWVLDCYCSDRNEINETIKRQAGTVCSLAVRLARVYGLSLQPIGCTTCTSSLACEEQQLPLVALYTCYAFLPFTERTEQWHLSEPQIPTQ